jgi:hypothetical protein
VQVTNPGVYIQEVSSGVHTITSVGTSITAFIDLFCEGPTKEPVEIFGMADFQRIFGGLDDRSEASYVAQHFLNGGSRPRGRRQGRGGPESAAREHAGDRRRAAGNPGHDGGDRQRGRAGCHPCRPRRAAPVARRSGADAAADRQRDVQRQQVAHRAEQHQRNLPHDRNARRPSLSRQPVVSLTSANLFTNGLLFGQALRATGNRLSERSVNALLSLFTLGERLNNTSFKQGDHCIIALDMNPAMAEVKLGNQVLIPNALCVSRYDVAAILFKPRG